MNDKIDNKSADKESVNESKHKQKGKHALKYDSIFKGKKEKKEPDEFDEFSSDFHVPKQESFQFDTSYAYYEESKRPDEHFRIKELRKEMYDIITTKTTINIKNSRRKPGRDDFNRYMKVLADNLDTSKYSYSEIFIEFSYYFSDNVVNMFKLLDKKWGGKVASELSKKSSINLGDMDFM